MGDFATEARAQIQAVLDVANMALAEIEVEIKHLVDRATQLRTFIRDGDALLATPRSQGQPPLLVASAPVHVPSVLGPAMPPSACLAAEAILAEAGYAMSVEDIFQHVAARNWLRGKAPKEALRMALRDHPNVFRRSRRGVYGLVAWSKPPAGGTAA